MVNKLLNCTPFARLATFVLRFTSFSIPLLYSTLWTSFFSHLPLLFTHTCLLWYLLLHSSHSHAQFMQPCTVHASMHSLRIHAQFVHPCTVLAALHSSCTVHTQPCTVPAQSTRSHAQFMSLSI